MQRLVQLLRSAFLPIGRELIPIIDVVQIFNAMYADGTCKSNTGADGTITRLACPDAYGKLLGKLARTVFE